MEVAPNVHLVPGVMGHAYLIVDPDGLTIIDTGLPRSHKAILTYLRQVGRTPNDIRRILVTHADRDHVGGLPALRAACGAQTYASAVEAEAIRRGQMSRQIRRQGWMALLAVVVRFFPTEPAAIDVTLTDGDELPVLGGLRCLLTPGHTPGHLSFYAPGPRVLFCGDSMVAEGGRLRISGGANTWDQTKANESAHRQAELGARIICPGHGPVVRVEGPAFPFA